MVTHEIRLLLELLQRVDKASKGLRFHKEKGRRLNDRIQLLDKNVRSIQNEPQPELYGVALSALHLHLRTAETIFHECSKSIMYRTFNYRRIMDGIIQVNQDTTQSLVDIQFIEPKEDTVALISEFWQGFKGLDLLESANQLEGCPEVDQRDPLAVCEAIKGLQKEGRVTAADIEKYQQDLQDMKRLNEDLMEKKMAVEDFVVSQLLEMLSQMTMPSGRKEDLPVPPDYKCPIGMDIMSDPVILIESGVTFDRGNIDTWFRTGKRTCPVTNQTLSSTHYVRNMALRNSIQGWAKEHGMELPALSPTSPLGVGSDLGSSKAAGSTPVLHLGIAELRRRANESDADAQLELALCYYIPRQGASCDMRKAVEWLEHASEHGVARAQALLSHCYFDAIGVELDKAEGVRRARFIESAEQPIAQYVLGEALLEGFGGVDKSEMAAEMLFRLAKRSFERLVQQFGDPIDQYFLAKCYELGRGVSKDEACALEWYRKAAEQGYAHAQYTLGVCYELGKGVGKDEGLALEWYRKAADQGHMQAQRTLSESYASGSRGSNEARPTEPGTQQVAEQADARVISSTMASPQVSCQSSDCGTAVIDTAVIPREESAAAAIEAVSVPEVTPQLGQPMLEAPPKAREGERVEQVSRGVYLTLRTPPNGKMELTRLRFSRKLFSEADAERWWAENRIQVLGKFGIVGDLRLHKSTRIPQLPFQFPTLDCHTPSNMSFNMMTLGVEPTKW